jgi:hypothetical protein
MVKNASHRRRFVGLLAIPVMIGCAVIVKAQPNAQQTQTAQQEQKQYRSRLITSMRLSMRIHQLNDEELQNTLITFLIEQGVARRNLRAQGAKLREAMRNTMLSDTQVSEILRSYRAASEQTKADYNKALIELDAKIGYSKNPRLEATLVMLNIIGDEESVGYGPANFGLYADTPNPAQ